MNEKQLLKEYENMTVEEKTAFNTMLHTTKLFAKINGLDEAEALIIINDHYLEIAKALGTDSTVTKIASTIDAAVMQCQNKLEELNYGVPPINYTHLKWVV